MLKFRRSAPPSRTEPAAPRVASTAASNAQKAHALLAMLEPGGRAADISPDRLRDWARDLVETVERRGTNIATVRPSPAPIEPALPATIFRSAAPVLTPAVVSAPAPATRQDRRSSAAYEAPVPHVAAVSTLSAPKVAAIHSRGEVNRLIAAAVHPDAMAQEHPAVIAMSLLGRPTLEQAALLRRLPSGQARAVHKALRGMEAEAGVSVRRLAG